MRTPLNWTTRLAAICILVTLAAGCATRGYNRADHAAATAQSAARQIDQGASELELAIAALAELADGEGADRLIRFSKFNGAVDHLGSLPKEIAGNSAAIQQRGAIYFKKWDEELGRIQNDEIRSRSAARKTEVSQDFERVQANYQPTAAVLAPFIEKLRDIRTALSTDLTPAGLDAIRGSINAAKMEGVSVVISMRSLAADYRALANSLQPVATHPTTVPQPDSAAPPSTQPQTPSVGN